MVTLKQQQQQQQSQNHFRWYKLQLSYIVDTSTFTSSLDFLHFAVLPCSFSTDIRLFHEEIEELKDVIQVNRFNGRDVERYHVMIIEHLKNGMKEKGYKVEMENIHIIKMDPFIAIRGVDKEL